MPPNKPNTGKNISWTKSIRWIACVLLLFLQGVILAGKIQTAPVYEETSLTLSVEKIGTSEIPAVISGKKAYLSISGLFNFLKIKNSLSKGMDSVSGFFLDPSDPFLIDKSSNSIRYKGKEFFLNSTDLIRIRTNLFLCTSVYQDVFGLEFTFSLKTLVINLHAKVELPVIRTIIQEEKRKYIRKQKGEIVADTMLKKSYPVLHLGTADWAIYSTQTIKGVSNTRATLNLGGYLAGVEANIGFNYYSNQPFMARDQYFRLRYVNNENPFIRQVTAGNIATTTISSIFSNIAGIQVTNAPTTFRKYYGTYTLNDKTQPGWIVELYVNGTLVDYVKADASGFFSFEVPLSYGTTEIELKYYGPWGEVRTSHKNILVPYSFLPKHEAEYSLSAGLLEDSLNQQFYRAGVNYGLTRNFCIGGGNEYLSSIKSGKNIPFLNSSFCIARNLIFSGEFAYGVREKIMASYHLPSNFIIELDYIHYAKGQSAIFNNYREERKGSISLPLQLKNFSIFSRISADQVILPDHHQMTLTDLLVSAFYKRFSGNLHTYGFFSFYGKPLVYSDLAIGIRLPKGFNLTPSVRFDHIRNQFLGWKCMVEKPFNGNGYFNVSYEEYPDNKIRNLQIGFRYLLPFAQVMVNANHYRNSANISEAMTGSLIINTAGQGIEARNINKVGKGGIGIMPFLDINGNGKWDKGEPRVSGVTVKMLTGGLVEKENKDTLILIHDLEPYEKSIFEVNISHVQNISWQIRNKTYSVPIEPNMVKLVDVPVCVVSEFSGSLNTLAGDKKGNNQQVRISIYRNDTNLIASVYPEKNGTFNYLGLTPGNYTLMPDTAFLRNNQMKCFPPSRNFIIHSSIDGEVLNGMNFRLETLKPGTSILLSSLPDSALYVSEEKQTEYVSLKSTIADTASKKSSFTGYALQVGSFRGHSNALALEKKISSTLKVPVEIIKIRDYYSVLVTGFETHQQAMQMMNELKEKGFHGIYIRLLKDGDAL